MADLITRLKLQNGEFNGPLEDSKKKVGEFQNKTEDASKTIDDLGKKGSKSAKELLSELKDIDKGTRSISNYRRQLAEIQKQIADLTINYRNMNAEMQNSSIGQEVAAKIQELTQQAATYKDAIMDSQSAIKAMASDTAPWDAMKMGIDTASAALQGFVAMGVLGEKSTEKLVAVIAKLKSIEAATNAVIKVGTALQKDSALMIGISRIQTAALAKAKTLEAAATGKATLAQKAFNLVAKANPYLLLASAILVVVAAVGAFTLATKKNNSEVERAKRIQEGYNKALGDGRIQAGDSIAKFQLLRTQYMNLRTEAEKTQWIENNKDKFSELGVELNNIADAQKWLVDNAADFIKALTLEAEAAALMSYYQEEYKKGIEESLKAQDKAENKKAGTISKKDIEKYGLKEGEDYTKTTIPGSTSPTGITTPPTYIYEWTAAGEEKMKKAGEEAGEAVLEGYSESLKPAAEMAATKLAQAEDLRKKSAPTTKNNNNNNNGPKKEAEAALDSLTKAQEVLAKMQKEFEAMSPNAEGFEDAKKSLEDQKALVEELKKKYEAVGPEVLSQKAKLEEEKKNLEEQLKYIEEGTEEWKRQMSEIVAVEAKIKDLQDATEAYKKRLANPIKPIEMPINPIPTGKAVVMDIDPNVKRERLVEEFNKARDEVSKIKNWLDLGVIGQSEAQKLVDNINATLAKKGIKATVSLDLEVKTPQDVLNDYVDSFDGFSSIANGTVGSINSIYDAVSSLSDKLSESESAWESFFAVFQTGMTIFQSFTSIVEAISKATELMNTATAAGIAIKNQDTVATESNAAAHLSDAGAIGAEASAAAGKSVASIPMVGPVLAVAAIASVLAAIMTAISSAKKFSTGGIFDGKPGVDTNLAWISDGEMILNKKQQSNLFKLLDEGRGSTRTISGDVNFKIKGSDLVGTLTNYSNKRSKI